MRHPLLIDKTKVIGNDFVLSADQPAIVFSGPNAGGKTIALKSIGVALDGQTWYADPCARMLE